MMFTWIVDFLVAGVMVWGIMKIKKKVQLSLNLFFMFLKFKKYNCFLG